MTKCGFNPFIPEGMRADIIESDTEYKLVLDAYEINKENISLKYEDDKLTISYKFKEEDIEQNEETVNYLLNERVNCNKSRTFYLPYSDIAAATANVKDGLLNITLPKEVDRVKNIVIE